MFRQKLVSILSVLFILFSCSSEDNDPNTPTDDPSSSVVLIFGWYAQSNCSGHCSDLFMIDEENVYKDVNGNRPSDTFYDGNFELFSKASHENYEALISELPPELFDAPNGCLSTVDCNDTFGGFYIEYKDDKGFHKSWQFNTEPEYIVNYRSLLLDKLAELNSL